VSTVQGVVDESPGVVRNVNVFSDRAVPEHNIGNDQ